MTIERKEVTIEKTETRFVAKCEHCDNEAPVPAFFRAIVRTAVPGWILISKGPTALDVCSWYCAEAVTRKLAIEGTSK